VGLWHIFTTHSHTIPDHPRIIPYCYSRLLWTLGNWLAKPHRA